MAFPPRRAVLRWGWRLFPAGEWRQQLLILGLLTVAVAATIWGAGVATNTLPYNPNYATFGTAAALVTLPGSDPHLGIPVDRQRFGRPGVKYPIGVISVNVPGVVNVVAW